MNKRFSTSLISLGLMTCVVTQYVHSFENEGIETHSSDDDFWDLEEERTPFQPYSEHHSLKEPTFFALDKKELTQAEPPIPVTPLVEPEKITPPLLEEVVVEEPASEKTILIQFNNVSIIEYLRFISKLTNKNFIFDDQDLKFNVTVVSEEPTSLENVMTALLQELRIHGFTMLEQGNNILIHKNFDVQAISKVSIDTPPPLNVKDSEIVTQVFRLNTLDPQKAGAILTPLISKGALLEVSEGTRQIIITDLVSNINQISKLLKGIDSPTGGLVIGQYMVRNTFVDTVIELAKQIMAPIAQDQPLTFVTHPTAQSVFVIGSPFLVERTLSVLQHLDQKQGETKIFDLEDLKFKPIVPFEKAPGTSAESGAGIGPEGAATPGEETTGRWELDPSGKWVFRPGRAGADLPKGRWILDPQNKWYFLPDGATAPFDTSNMSSLKPGEAPGGTWKLDKDGKWVYELNAGETIKPERLIREVQSSQNLPIGHIERTKFFLYKLLYRQGNDVVGALQSIGTSLEDRGVVNDDLILSINSIQWIEPTNSLIITGTGESIDKIRELLESIDTPLRQVFIEMLILETDVDDSLKYGVDWGTRSGGGQTSTAQGFLSGASALSGALFDPAGLALPNAGPLAKATGFHLGIIGQRITHNGTQFATIGALLNFAHDDSRTNIVMNPKVIIEDNKSAEVFVGINTQFQTDSIANDQGSILTTNYEFRDVGTTLNVTPHIGNNNIITLEINLENSSVTTAPTSQAQNLINSPGPTTSINRTNTTVHVPDGFFVVLSGMLQDQLFKRRNQIPCLGGIPILGAAFKADDRQDRKRNLMIFIRPVIVDTEEEFNRLTKQQQDMYRQKNRNKEDWKFHMDGALEYLNLLESCDPCEPCRN